jgi:hypothetical protein
MAAKIGSEFAKDFWDRGRRELGGFFFPDSNIAQPMYPLRGGYSIGKEVEPPAADARESSVLGEHLERANQARDDRDQNEPDKGQERE